MPPARTARTRTADCLWCTVVCYTAARVDRVARGLGDVAGRLELLTDSRAAGVPFCPDDPSRYAAVVILLLSKIDTLLLEH